MPAARSAQPRRLAHFTRNRRAPLNGAARRHAGLLSRPGIQPAEIETRLEPQAPASKCSTTGRCSSAPSTALVEATRSAGSRAAWSSARARLAPARSSATRAIPQCRRTLNLQDQVPRELPAVRALGAGRGRRRLFRAGRRRARTCCSWRTCSGTAGAYMTERARNSCSASTS